MRHWSILRSAAAVAIGMALIISTSTVVHAQTATPRIVPASLRIRAFGDGVTAGFGFDSSGTVLPLSDTMLCRPQWISDGSVTTAGTRCSSNGSNGPGSPADEIAFSADFGLAKKASWAAQVASRLNAVDFANYAVTGSTLASWLNLPHDDNAPAEGAQHDLLERIERDDPDIVLATIGGELLQQQPAGAVRTCAKWNGEELDGTQFLPCVNALLDRLLTKQRIMAIAFDVLAHTQNSKLLFATYLPAEPQFSALVPWQQVVLAQAINAQIVSAVAAVAESGAAWAQRIDVVQTAVQEDRCPPIVLRGPSFLGRNWFSLVGRCGTTLGTFVATEGSFTPVSLGTVPDQLGQMLLSQSAESVLRAHGWV